MFFSVSEQVDAPFPNQKKTKHKRPLQNNFLHPTVFKGLAGSERVRGEKKKLKSERSNGRKIVAIGLPFLFLLWAVGCAVWIAMLIGSRKYEEITQNPLDFLTPTWMRPQLSVDSLLFIGALKEVCPSALYFVFALKYLGKSRFCSFWGDYYNWRIKY